MINYLASTSRPDVLFSVYQAARFCSNPKCSYKEAVKRVGRHLKRTADKGIMYEFDFTKRIEVFVDAIFARVRILKKVIS